MVYLASPYSHKDPLVRLARFEAVCRVAGELMGNGFVVFAPIAHSHPIAELTRLPTDWAYWEVFDREFLRACSAIYVLQLPGWEESVGVQAEIRIAQELGLPVTYIATSN
jgi:hypothetical protein